MSKVQSINEARKNKGAQGGRAKAKGLDERVAALNKEYALAMVADKALVLREGLDFLGKPLVSFLSLGAFLVRWENERVWDYETDKYTGLGHIWKKHPDRRTYDGLAFAPEGVPDKSWYNLWRGFAVQPAPAYDDYRDHARRHFPTLWDHVLTNIAQNDVDLAMWIWGWFADVIKNPTRKGGTALVLRGGQGAGKSKLGEVVGSLLGPHWVKVSQPKHLTGTFNAHMAACLLLQADEGFWAGSKEAEGVLKDLVTSDVHQLEKKGVDAVTVRNLIRLFVSSNNSWVVPAGFDERRFAVLDVGEGRKQDHAYFARIDAELNDGGREHLLAYLLAFPLDKVNLRKIPQTEALWEQKIASMSELHHWWYERLQEGTLLPSDRKWTEDVPVTRLYDNFWRFFDRISKARKPPKAQWAIELRKMLPAKPGGGAPFRDGQKVWVQDYEDGVPKRDHEGTPMMKRVNGWKDFPGLRECREKFEAMVGRKLVWSADETEAAGEGESGANAPPSGGGQAWDGGVVHQRGGGGSDFDLTDG
ncbi:MAG: hypothetical protein HQL42_13160 [Alphaproteobacteria bacterium]|nr:hypothetical protein [Alphaproteobacteria bacterium]